MPKYYCDYCDTYLTHDSPSVRKTHCQGRKHKDNVKFYYQKWMEDQAQQLIDTTTAMYKAGKIANNPYATQKGISVPPPGPMGILPGGFPMPPMSAPPGLLPPPHPNTLSHAGSSRPPHGMNPMMVPSMMRTGPITPMMMPIPPPVSQGRPPLLPNPQVNMLPPITK